MHSERNPIVGNHVSWVGGHSFCSWFITEALPHLPIGEHFQSSHGDIRWWMGGRIEYFSWLTSHPLMPSLICDSERETSTICLSLDSCVCVCFIWRLLYVRCYISVFLSLFGVLCWRLFLSSKLQSCSQLCGADSGVQLPLAFWKEMWFLCCPEWLFLILVFL